MKTPAPIKTLKELKTRLSAMGEITKAQKKEITCTLIGHSNIVENCFGYVTCARCETQLGDTLAGSYKNDASVIVGHKCDICITNYAKMNWRDKFLSPNPFKP